jgi:hypothetical protein
MQVAARIWWTFAEIILAVALMLVFFSWAPWLGAQPVSEMPTDIVATLPANCPAVTGSHGTYYCFSSGTIRSNPTGFALHTALLAALFGTFIFIGLSGRGWWPKRGLPPNKSLERTRER